MKQDDNGQDNIGAQQDYGERIYDPRLGRFLSVDPLSPKYPELTPYQFASNTPIWGVDWDGAEVRIYTETTGTGHTFLTVGDGNKLVLYTYGRYAGSDWYTGGTTGQGVLIRYTGPQAMSYIKTELYQNEVKVFQIADVKDASVMSAVDKVYNSSKILPDSKNKDIRQYGHVVDTYSLFGNNCTTTTCDALKRSGTDIFDVQGSFFEYDQDFTIPISLQNFLIDKTKLPNSKVNNVTNVLKTEFPKDPNGKGVLKSAGSSGETSGASGSSAGASANTSSTTASSSGNGSGSFGSGSSSSQDVDPIPVTPVDKP